MFLLSLTSSFLNAVNALYAKKITAEIKNSHSFIVVSFVYVGLFLALIMPWYYSFHVTPISLVLLVGVVLLDTISNVTFFLALERIEVSRLTVYTALTPIFTFIPNSMLHGFSLHVLISVLFIVFGVYLLNIKGGHLLSPILELKKPGNLLGLVTSIAAGISMVPSQQMLTHQWINAPTLYFFRAWGIAILIFVIYRPPVWFPRVNLHFSMRGVLAIVQWVSLFTALRSADGTLVVALAYTSPLFAVFLARIYFKERITMSKLAACLVTIFGILWAIT